jgi:hypothetical protein
MFPVFIPMSQSSGPAGPMPPAFKRCLAVYGGMILGSIAYHTGAEISKKMDACARKKEEYKIGDFFDDVDSGFAPGLFYGVLSPMLVVTAIVGFPMYMYKKSTKDCVK